MNFPPRFLLLLTPQETRTVFSFRTMWNLIWVNLCVTKTFFTSFHWIHQWANEKVGSFSFQFNSIWTTTEFLAEKLLLMSEKFYFNLQQATKWIRNLIQLILEILFDSCCRQRHLHHILTNICIAPNDITDRILKSFRGKLWKKLWWWVCNKVWKTEWVVDNLNVNLFISAWTIIG